MPPKAAKKRPAESAAAVEDSSAGADTSAPSPAKKGRGRPKGSGKKTPKVLIPSGRGRGRPPLSAEEKAKRKVNRDTESKESPPSKPLGRPKKGGRK
ncbi:hypothetical protein ACOMHN_004813 [Nucella lapillus]